MTPQLARAVEYLTCPRCLGNGTLGHAVNARWNGLAVVDCERLGVVCTDCLGTGLRK